MSAIAETSRKRANVYEEPVALATTLIYYFLFILHLEPQVFFDGDLVLTGFDDFATSLPPCFWDK
jgi:hypothetical protein